MSAHMSRQSRGGGATTSRSCERCPAAARSCWTRSGSVSSLGQRPRCAARSVSRGGSCAPRRRLLGARSAVLSSSGARGPSRTLVRPSQGLSMHSMPRPSCSSATPSPAARATSPEAPSPWGVTAPAAAYGPGSTVVRAHRRACRARSPGGKEPSSWPRDRDQRRDGVGVERGCCNTQAVPQLAAEPLGAVGGVLGKHGT